MLIVFALIVHTLRVEHSPGRSASQSSCQRECSRSLAGRFRQGGLAVCWGAVYFDVIEHPIHCQLSQHDDLLNGQDRAPLRKVDV